MEALPGSKSILNVSKLPDSLTDGQSGFMPNR